MQNNENNHEGAEREKRQRKIKNNVQLQNKFDKGSFIYGIRKKSEIRNPFSNSIHKHPILVRDHPTFRRP